MLIIIVLVKHTDYMYIIVLLYFACKDKVMVNIPSIKYQVITDIDIHKTVVGSYYSIEK